MDWLHCAAVAGTDTCGSLIGIEQTDSGTGEPGEVSCVISARGMSVYL